MIAPRLRRAGRDRHDFPARDAVPELDQAVRVRAREDGRGLCRGQAADLVSTGIEREDAPLRLGVPDADDTVSGDAREVEPVPQEHRRIRLSPERRSRWRDQQRTAHRPVLDLLEQLRALRIAELSERSGPALRLSDRVADGEGRAVRRDRERAAPVGRWLPRQQLRRDLGPGRIARLGVRHGRSHGLAIDERLPLEALQDLVGSVGRQHTVACFADRTEPGYRKKNRNDEDVQIFLAELEQVVARSQRELGLAQHPPDVRPGAHARLEACDLLGAVLRAERRQRHGDAAAERERGGDGQAQNLGRGAHSRDLNRCAAR